jgi:hypothetical protein
LAGALEKHPNRVESVRAVADGIEGAQFAYIRGVCHFAPFTAIDTFYRIVSIFLRGESLPQEEWQP